MTGPLDERRTPLSPLVEQYRPVREARKMWLRIDQQLSLEVDDLTISARGATARPPEQGHTFRPPGGTRVCYHRSARAENNHKETQ